MADDKRRGWGALLPRFNIPETFGTALSYEGQLHWFLENWDQVAEYANELEQPTVTVGKTEFPDTGNALLPSITNSGTDINAVLDFTYPLIRERFADPLQWHPDTSYDVLTIVEDGGAAYLSKQTVPKGIDISDAGYWYPLTKQAVDAAKMAADAADLAGDLTVSTIDKWLDEHPEATTTVLDGAITSAKINESVSLTDGEIDEIMGVSNG